MKILITGGSGFIGKHIADSLSVSHLVTGMDMMAYRKSKIKILQADLLDFDNCKKVCRENNFIQADVIIHLASAMANAGNVDEVDILNHNNNLSANIASLAMFLGVKKLINFSSSSVYPNVTGTFSETSEINPSRNPDAIYGLSKFNSEIIIKKMLSAENICLTNLRCVMVYGEGVNKTRIWPVMETELANNNTITVFGNGKRLINQIHVSKLSELVKKLITKDYPGVFNISEETISLYELAERIIYEKGNPESKIIKIEKGNTEQFKIDNSKSKKIF